MSLSRNIKPLNRKSLILKSKTHDKEVVFVGGPCDGSSMLVDPVNNPTIQVAGTYYTKVNLEDNRGFSVVFYRHCNLSDLQAVGLLLQKYPRR